MKKQFIPVLLFVVAGMATAGAQEKNEVKWYGFEEAVALSSKEPRKLFIDVYTDWCGWCKKMDKETFTHPVIIELLNTKFYAVKFNAESKEPVTFAGKTFVNEGAKPRSPHQLAIALLQGQMGYPSAVYMDEDLQLLAPIPGYFSARDLEPILNYFVVEGYKSISLQDYIKSFEGRIQAAK